MKKTITIMALALVAIFSITMFAACGYPSDPAKARDQLQDSGYTVEAVIGETEGAIKVQQGLLDITGATMGLESGSLIASVNGQRNQDGKFQAVTIYYFKDSASANKAWDSTFIQKLREHAEKGSNIKKSGKMIYIELSTEETK